MKDSDDKKKAKGTGAGLAVGAAAGGVAGGAAAGAAAGGLTGPVGAAIGAAVGAAVGALSGRGAAGADDEHSSTTRSTEPEFRDDDAGRVGTSGTHTGQSHQSVIGAFDDPATAQRAVDRLVQSGFAREDVHLEHRQGGQQAGADADFFPQLFGTGSSAGADGRVQQNPYAGHAHTYDEAVRRGSAVVVVDAQDDTQADRACTLMHEMGAIDVDERSQQWRADGWQPPQGMGQDLAGSSRAAEDGVLDVVEEQLKVGKRTMDRGGVRVVQRVSSKPVRELVRLREEHAVVERRPVDRAATGQDLSDFREGTLEVRETVEEPVVAKTARVVEEVRVGKEVREREETIEDTLRRKDVEIERLPGGGQPGRMSERERAVAADDPLSRTRGGGDKPKL